MNNVLGFDASGVVVKSSESALFREGDQVIFAGVIGRSGSNGQYAVVDSRIAGRKPAGWSNAEAASLPLVGLTAWEMLHCHFGLVPFSRPKKEETLVIVNGAGGVGTMATQLARYVRISIPLVITSTHYSLNSPTPTLRFSESITSSSLPLVRRQSTGQKRTEPHTRSATESPLLLSSRSSV